MAGARAPAGFWGVSGFGRCAPFGSSRGGASRSATLAWLVWRLAWTHGRLATTVAQRQIRVPHHGHCSPARDQTGGCGRRGNPWLGRRTFLILPQPARDYDRWLRGMRRLQQRVGINLDSTGRTDGSSVNVS